ncbi:MAG: DUF2244 domain-containing protein [Pseudomonadota bacterium]
MSVVPRIARKEASAEPVYSAVLRPHRSLDRQGFLILMAAITVVSFIAGIAFLIIGAWPVMGFFGLDVLLIYWAFRKNFADRESFEQIDLFPEELVIRREIRSRPAEEWRFHPYWVRLELEEDEELETCGPLWLTSHGKRLQLGSFLGPNQLRAFSEDLHAALRRN